MKKFWIVCTFVLLAAMYLHFSGTFADLKGMLWQEKEDSMTCVHGGERQVENGSTESCYRLSWGTPYETNAPEATYMDGDYAFEKGSSAIASSSATAQFVEDLGHYRGLKDKLHLKY